jgi:hypothetical protein
MPNSFDQSPTAAEIISALERTGFLLEQRGARILKNAGFNVILNDAFPDPDTGKSRETDIFGMLERQARKSGSIQVAGHVLVECKNYSTPLVLVGTNREQSFFHIDSKFVSFDPFSLGFPNTPLVTILGKLGIVQAHPDGQTGLFVGNQLVRMDRKSGIWAADNSSVYESILYPLVKARQHEFERNNGENPGLEPWEYPTFIYYFPILLTSGEVFTVEISEEGLPGVTKVKWATLNRSFHSKELTTELYADVVTLEHFNEYLQKRVISTVDHVWETLSNNSHLYDPAWLLANYGRPKRRDDFDKWLEAAHKKSR